MTNLDDLKRICSDKQKIVENLHNNIRNFIIKRDMKLLIEKYKDFHEIRPDTYKIGDFEYKVNNNILEITDERKNAYLWCFEVILNNKDLRIGDCFTYNNEVYSVSIIDNIKDNKILKEIEKVISDYDKTIEFFKNHNDFTKYTYYYDCSHDNIKCLDIFKVYNTVMNRKYGLIDL